MGRGESSKNTMQMLHSEQCRNHPSCELRIGKSSWDDNVLSIKFVWFTSTGAPARGGEVPLDALLQMLEMAIRLGYVKLK
jgi:hypothetical protein